jgi:hypothetical protein
MKKIDYVGYRFPPAIIQQAIWLYFRFTLSFRDVEDLLAERMPLSDIPRASGRSFRSCGSSKDDVPRRGSPLPTASRGNWEARMAYKIASSGSCSPKVLTALTAGVSAS